jgi:uncharacterized membrane protein
MNYTKRIRSIDVLRGAIMVLMVIDHVRVYTGQPPGGPGPGIFFTRWVTHFCAPVFCFFAGTAAFFNGIKMGSKAKLARFLVTRGLLLVVLELTLVRFGWTFNLDFSNFMLAGIIWMLGWSMILMAAFVWLKPRTIGIIGLAIIFGQQVFAWLPSLLPVDMRNAIGPVWQCLYPADLPGPSAIAILYVIVPWVGVMMAGYGFGTILNMDPVRSKAACIWIGISAIIIFLAWGSAVATEQDGDPFLFRLLSQRKYPASPLYLMMTLGPVIALVPLAERAKNRVTKWLGTIGRVPMFYYLLHLPLAHASALLVMYIKEGFVSNQWYETAPFSNLPPEQKWPLALLYLVFLINVIILYFACRWYAKYKTANPGKKWLSYI